ncbi:B- and T-lymphocyte attenuator-like [Centroberyx affinis]|uniref:B- and T-lymphocyte attenuator-like n=1 Tax=Centroberyx affinis TaxID=166261 RepID=UPI003A5C0DB5
MTGGFQSASTMRPNRCWTVLHVSVLAALLLTLDADSQEVSGEDSDCDLEIKVRRNTGYNASLGENLRIHCTVVFCNNSPPTISWYKLYPSFTPVHFNSSTHITTEWKISGNLEGISYLDFTNILTSDSGVYQCHGGGQVSHSINVSVSDSVVELTTVTVTSKNDTNTTINQDRNSMEALWPYVYIVAGITALVIIVIIISVLSMRGCKGESKKERQSENQYMAIPMTEQPSAHPCLQPPPRVSPTSHHALPSRGPECIYDNTPPRPPDRKNAACLEPNQTTVSGDNDHIYSKTKKEGERKRKKGRKGAEEEEESPVVYAALNHQIPPGASVRPPRPMEESSEYAAIRVP